MRKFLITVIACFSLFSFSAAHAAVDMTDPYKMVIEVADQAFSKIKANSDKMKDVSFRKELIRRDLLPYVDTGYAALKVMGVHAKKATKEERSAFTKAFAEYIVASYADALALYDKQDLIPPAYKKADADASFVNTKFLIREAGKPDLELIFKLRKNSKTGEWKVFDMVAEGISMLSSKESELSPLIREKGMAHVISLLEKNALNGKVSE